MNFFEIGDDFAINLDRVQDIQIIDIENKDDITKPHYIIAFTLDLVESVRVLPNSPDEDDIETSHFQTREYDYAMRMTPPFESYDKAKRAFNQIIGIVNSKKEKK